MLIIINKAKKLSLDSFIIDDLKLRVNPSGFALDGKNAYYFPFERSMIAPESSGLLINQPINHQFRNISYIQSPRILI